MRKWRPRLEINCEARQFGVGVRGGVEQVALRARMHHETKNWLVLADCSNAFNAVERTKLAASRGLLQRVQRGRTDGGARGGGHLRAGTHTFRRQM